MTEPDPESFDASSSDNLDDDASKMGNIVRRSMTNPVEVSYPMVVMMSLLTAWMKMMGALSEVVGWVRATILFMSLLSSSMLCISSNRKLIAETV